MSGHIEFDPAGAMKVRSARTRGMMEEGDVLQPAHIENSSQNFMVSTDATNMLQERTMTKAKNSSTQPEQYRPGDEVQYFREGYGPTGKPFWEEAAGHIVGKPSRTEVATVEAAKDWCEKNQPGCTGFTHAGKPKPDGPVEVHFYEEWNVNASDKWTSYHYAQAWGPFQQWMDALVSAVGKDGTVYIDLRVDAEDVPESQGRTVKLYVKKEDVPHYIRRPPEGAPPSPHDRVAPPQSLAYREGDRVEYLYQNSSATQSRWRDGHVCAVGVDGTIWIELNQDTYDGASGYQDIVYARVQDFQDRLKKKHDLAPVVLPQAQHVKASAFRSDRNEARSDAMHFLLLACWMSLGSRVFP